MRKFALVILAAGAGMIAAPLAVQAQTTTTTTTVRTQDPATDAWNKIKGAWTQSKGAVKEQWGKLTDDDVTEVDGKRDILVGKIQTRYGISKAEAEAQVGGFETKYKSN
jgi:uncharacterized protein YjbJ (UPF0337 family)